MGSQNGDMVLPKVHGGVGQQKVTPETVTDWAIAIGLEEPVLLDGGGGAHRRLYRLADSTDQVMVSWKQVMDGNLLTQNASDTYEIRCGEEIRKGSVGPCPTLGRCLGPVEGSMLP